MRTKVSPDRAPASPRLRARPAQGASPRSVLPRLIFCRRTSRRLMQGCCNRNPGSKLSPGPGGPFYRSRLNLSNSTKALQFLLLAFGVAGCARSDRWSVASVRDLSEQDYRRLQVEVVTKGAVPWPLKLSVSAVDASQRRIESTLPRWTARQVSPNSVAFAFAEPISSKTKPITLDLKIAAAGHAPLHIHHVFADIDQLAQQPFCADHRATRRVCGRSTCAATTLARIGIDLP